MIKVKIISSGEIVEVTRNEAFGLIDSGKGKLYVTQNTNKGYKSRMLKVEPLGKKSKVKTK